VEGKGYKNIINLPDLPDKRNKHQNPEYRHNMASFFCWSFSPVMEIS